MKRIWKWMAVAFLCSGISAGVARPQSPATAPPPTPEEAKKFIEDAEQRLFDLGIKAGRAAWVQQNFITVDTEQIAADAGEEANTLATQYAKQAHRFDHVALSPELARKRLSPGTCRRFPRAATIRSCKRSSRKS